MFSFSLIVILAGAIILIGITIWTNQRTQLGNQPELEHNLRVQSSQAPSENAVIVAREHGQVLYINDQLRGWLKLGGGLPRLEYFASVANPQDNFRALFTTPSRAAFQFGPHWVEATSSMIPDERELRVVVTMRQLQHSADLSPDADLDISAAMLIIDEIGETVNAGLGVDQSLQTMLTIISKNIEVDGAEITLWDKSAEALYQRGWVGDAAYVLALATDGGAYQLGEGMSGWIAKNRQPLLVPDVAAPDAVVPKIEENPYRSFAGVPLVLGERFIGTLEVTHQQAGYFNRRHLSLLGAIAKPVATAVYNAELYAAQIKRIDDIASLQQITQGQDLAQNVSGVYYALNERVASLVDAEVSGVMLYDERREEVLPQIPFYGLPDQLVSILSIDVASGAPASDIWEQQPYWISNDPGDDPMVEAMNLAPVVNAAGLRNLILLVMQIGQGRIGMMFVANKRGLGGFSTLDVQNLRILVTQAAIVVENIRLFQRGQRQDTELVGLQEITHAIGALSSNDPVFVYSDINTRIAGLMSLEMVGVLLYDEARQTLVRQLPFYGVPDSELEDYEIDLGANLVLRELWESEDYWYTNRAQADTIVFSAGLAETAERIGVEKTMIASLVAGGQKIGALQVSNKVNGEDFTDNDARLLMIFATQAAAILENARLVREVQRRALESERLRRIAERAGDVVALDERLIPVLSEVGQLTDSRLVFLSVIHEGSGALVLTPRAVFGAELDTTVRYDHDHEDFASCIAVSKRSLLTNDAPNDLVEHSLYRRLTEKLSLESLILTPLVIGDRGLGELGVANRADAPYTDEDLELVESIAAQLSSTIDRVRLFEAAGQSLDRRVNELDAISAISDVLNQTIDLNTILKAISDEAAAATGADGGTVAVVVPVEAVDTPPDPEETPELAYRVSGKDQVPRLIDIERTALADEDGIVVVEDYELTDMEPLPTGTVSAAALTFNYAGRPVGIIHLFDDRRAFFDERSVSFLRTMSSKAALGYGNAVRYHEQMERSRVLRQRVEQLNQIFELGQMIQTNVDQEMMLEAIAFSIVQSAGFDVVVITMVDTATGLLRREVQAGLPVDIFERSRGDAISVADLDSILSDDYRISESYFLPIERILKMEIAGLDALSAAFAGNRTMHGTGKDAWKDGDMLLVPITGANSELLGIISLDRPQDNLRPNRNQVEVLEIFAHQAATTIENNRLYVSSVQGAEQEARLNQMLEDIASTLDVDEIVESVAHNALRLAPFQQMDAALVTEDGFNWYRVVVKPDSSLVTTHSHASSIDDGTAMGVAFMENEEAVYTLEDHANGFRDLAEWRDAGERLAYVSPLVSGGEVLGAIHFGSSSEQDFDLNDYQRLFARVAQLMAVAIQNARLFNEAVNLRLFNESVLESIQQGIVVLDRARRVISANQFVQDEYDWDVTGARRDLFQYSPELEPILGDKLDLVLETADPQQILNERTSGDIVRNFYIYPLVTGAAASGAVLLVEDVSERVRLEATVAERANQLAALTRASGRITSSLQREEVIEIALDVMGDIIAFDTIALWRRETPGVLRLVGARNVNVDLNPPFRARTEDVERLQLITETQNPLTINELPIYLVQHSRPLPGDVNMSSWLGVPLVYQDDVVGIISIAKREPNFYNAQSEQAAMAFANQVAVALSNAALFEDTTARTERLSVLNRVSLALVQSMDSENIVEIALSEISNTVRSEKGRAIIFDASNEVGRVLVDTPRGETTPTRRIALRQSALFSYIMDNMQPLVYSHDPSLMPEELAHDVRAEIETRGLKDYLLIPMIAPGQLIGAFEFETRSRSLVLGAETLETGLIISNQSAIAIQNANQLEETTNRTRELETLLEAARSTSMTMDLNQVFQTVTDLFIRALDMDDCAIMIWDEFDNTLEVQVDVNRAGDPDRISPQGTRFDASKYPARAHALRSRDVVVVTVDDINADETEVAELRAQNDQARMFVPLVVQDQSRGLIQVEVSNPHRVITEQERRLAAALGAQVAVAIQNARLSTEAAAQMDELFIINDLSQAISANIDVDGMLEIVRDQVPGVTGAQQLYVALYDADTRQITFPLAVRDGESYDIEPRELGTDEVSFIIRNKRPLLLGSDYFAAEEVRASLGLTNGEGDVKSYLGVPLVAGDDVLGVLAVRDEENTRVFGVNDQRILTTVGSQLGATLQNARLFQRVQRFADEMNEEVQVRTEELQEERDRLDMLYQITAELALTLDMDRVLNRALQMMASAVKADDGVIMLIDPMTDRLYNRASLSREDMAEERPSHPAEMLATWLIHNEHELLETDLHEVDYWDHTVPGAEPWRSAIAVLLETNEDVQGVLVLLSRSVGAFSEPLMNLVIAAANQVASAINNADLYQLIRDQAERLGTLLRNEQEEAEKSNAILEGIADGVMLTDTQGQISLFNSAAEEMLGLPRDQVMGRTLPELIDQYGENVAAWAGPVMTWDEGRETRTSGYHPTDRIDVGDRVVSVTIAPVFVANQSLGTVSVFRDVTRDVEVDNLKNEFVLNVTHEFRTPMTSIKGYLELLMMNDMNEQQANVLPVIKSNTDRLAALVEDLLTVSKIDAGETLSIEPVDLANVIDIQLTNAQNRHYDKGHTVTLDVDESLPRAALDRRKTLQVVGNIIDNAFNYTPAGGNIEISLYEDPDRDDSILLSVADNGLGIPESFRDTIWDRFSRNEEHALATDTAGTGLGLSIVRELVRMQGGEVWFESQEGEGTVFYVSFPVEYKRTVTGTGPLTAVSGD
jgi:PAS domain S-box-containing protein